MVGEYIMLYYSFEIVCFMGYLGCIIYQLNGLVENC